MTLINLCGQIMCRNAVRGFRDCKILFSRNVISSSDVYIGSSIRSSRKFGYLSLLGRDQCNHDEQQRGYFYTGATGFFAAVIGATIYLWASDKPRFVVHAKEAEPSSKVKAGQRRSDLPTYKLDEVKKHASVKDGIWVTYKDGVYNISEFLDRHPGGRDKIQLASGASIEPYWELYSQHKTDEVAEILEEWRIGNIDEEDLKRMRESTTVSTDTYYKNEPARNPMLVVNSQKPFNAEPPPQITVDNIITPNEIFFIRNHLPVPSIVVSDDITSWYSLEVKVDDNRPTMKTPTKSLWRRKPSSIGVPLNKKISLGDIKKNSSRYPWHSVTTTIQCAGNRRSLMNLESKKVMGLQWGNTAISTATWTGIRLCDLLASCSVRRDDPFIKHVQFEGHDTDMTGATYGASIPFDMAMDPNREILIAFQMNGSDIPLDHGYPLRLIVPGVAGARQVKWLSKITLSDEESPSHWQQKDYKIFNPDTSAETANWKEAAAIQDCPVQSAICLPVSNQTLPDREYVTVRGYAWSGGGRGINDVSVTIDSGKTWHHADLDKLKDDRGNLLQKNGHEWAWTIWEITIPIPESYKGNNLEIWSKAVDSSHNVQPKEAAEIWNFRGLLNNSWHKVNVILPTT